MLFSLRHNFLFVHIAKTGGTSIRSALNRYRWSDPYQLVLFLCSRLSALTGHRLGIKFPRHAKVIAAKEMLPDELFDRLFKFTIVRNPWDRQVSAYHHLLRERPHLLQGVEGFEAFLRWKFDPERPYHYVVDSSAEPQADFVVDLSGRVIVDFIGRYERLEADFREICRRIGIACPRLPHKRRAREREDYRRYYSPSSAELVAEHFRRDIDMFGYRFDGPEAQGE